MKNEMQEAFRQEMKAIRDFFAIYKKSQPDLADIKEEDPDVQRLIETMAFFTAHTQVSSAKNIKNTEKRLWQEFFPFLFSPLPAMSILEAEVQTPNFKLATTLPKGAKVAVQMMESSAALNAKPKVANFYTSRDLKISPVLLKRIENYQQKNEFALIMSSRYQQSGAIGNLNLYVNYLDDYAKSLHLLLSIQDHLQKVEIVFKDQKQPLPCHVSFGLDRDSQDLASDYFEHPLYKARLFLHFPQQDLYINIFPDKRYTNLIPQTWSEYSIVFTFNEEWKSLDSLNELLDFQPFSINTVPMVNLSRDSSAVIHFDGTQIRQPIYSTQPGFSLQRIKGVYKIVDGLNVAIRPGFVRDDSESYEFEYFKNLAWLIYYSDDVYKQPAQLVVDGFWYQPWITDYLQKKITVSLYDRNINYVKWKLVLPIEPSTPSLLVDEPNEVLYLIFWQKKFFLDAEQQLSFLKSLPDIKKSVFHEIPDLITSLNIESCNTLYRQKIMYYIYFDQLTCTQLDLSKAFFRTLVLAMNAYTNSDLEFYIKVIQDKTSDYYITGKGKIHSGSKKE